MSESENRQRTKWLPAVRCFEEEQSEVREKAADCGVSVGQFMLRAALGRTTRSKVDSQILNELRRLGGLQKHLFNEGGGLNSREYSQVLIAIQDAISRVGK